MPEAILELRQLTIKFGGLVAVNNLDMSVDKGAVVGLIGPNGAGKTTVFNLISGVYRPYAGKVFFDGHDITGLPPHEVCRRGIARTFQIVKPFGKMNVLDNIMVGAFVRTGSRALSRKMAMEVAERVGLAAKKDTLAKNLTIADRKRLEIAKTLATQPKLLLLDEVLAGLNPAEVDDAIALVESINADGITILMIEHVLRATMAVCQHVVVLDYGKKIAEGTPQEVTSNSDVIKAYLGDEYETA